MSDAVKALLFTAGTALLLTFGLTLLGYGVYKIWKLIPMAKCPACDSRKTMFVREEDGIDVWACWECGGEFRQ